MTEHHLTTADDNPYRLTDEAITEIAVHFRLCQGGDASAWNDLTSDQRMYWREQTIAWLKALTICGWVVRKATTQEPPITDADRR